MDTVLFGAHIYPHDIMVYEYGMNRIESSSSWLGRDTTPVCGPGDQPVGPEQSACSERKGLSAEDMKGCS